MAELSRMTDYPPNYAELWAELAEQFDAVGMPATAESCRDRARHYAEVDRPSAAPAAAAESTPARASE